VPEDGEGRRRIDRQHRDLVAALDQEHAQRIDGGRFSDAGRAGDADPHRRAGVGQQRLHQLARRGLVIATPALDQRDRPRQRGAVTGTEVTGEGGGVRRGRLR